MNWNGMTKICFERTRLLHKGEHHSLLNGAVSKNVTVRRRYKDKSKSHMAILVYFSMRLE